MTKRDPVREWGRAIRRRGSAEGLRSLRPLVPQRPPETYDPPAPGELPAWLRRTRSVTPSSAMLPQGAEAILVLQRGNRLLRERFGIDWADAASVVFGEAQRRGASPVALARVLTTGLRRDARERRR